MHLPSSFRVVTLNILHDPPELSWPARASCVQAGLRALHPDIILLQEVVWPREQASDLAAFLEFSLGSCFAAHVTPLITPHGWQEGLAILTHYPLLERDELRYPDAEQFCQRLRLAIGNRAVDVYNTHLDPYAGDRRREQIRLIVHWMESQTDSGGIVFGGDLNATPDSDEIGTLRVALSSAHVTVHGREPTGTAPTPFGTHRRQQIVPLRTIDYLWHSSALSVTGCRLTFDQPDPYDPLLFPSDHYGLVADFRLTSEQGTSAS